ncbi:hypothetical protein D3C78_1324730 [compost metagenome]
MYQSGSSRTSSPRSSQGSTSGTVSSEMPRPSKVASRMATGSLRMMDSGSRNADSKPAALRIVAWRTRPVRLERSTMLSKWARSSGCSGQARAAR